MSKLQGQAYIDHWRNRMAKGPQEAGTAENGNDTWNFIKKSLTDDYRVEVVLEYGCAYGRMLHHLQQQWPDAKLIGVDLSRDALSHLEQNWLGPKPKLFNQGVPPKHIRADVIFTCTVLQHITDDDVLAQVVEGFRQILKPGGRLILFENITYAAGQGGDHMREFGAADYMNQWPELQWKNCGTFMHGKEAHALMIGEKQCLKKS